MPNKNNEWLMPTVAGMLVATFRRFRRKRDEPRTIVFLRFLSHTGTCVIAGYITAGLLLYFNYQELMAPVCALAGLYGTMLVDWIEEDGLALFKIVIKQRIERK